MQLVRIHDEIVLGEIAGMTDMLNAIRAQMEQILGAASQTAAAMDALWWTYMSPAQRRRWCKRLVRETIAERRRTR